MFECGQGGKTRSLRVSLRRRLPENGAHDFDNDLPNSSALVDHCEVDPSQEIVVVVENFKLGERGRVDEYSALVNR